MLVKDLPLFIRQLKNFFPDSKLNGPEGQAVLERYLNGPDQQANVSMDEFLIMLSAVERPSGLPFDESILHGKNKLIINWIDVDKTIKKKDGQISELKDRISMLSETNDSLRKEANEFSKTEISLRQTITQLEQQLEEKGSEGTVTSTASLKDAEYIIANQPVHEVQEKVYGFIDKLLEKTMTLSQDRMALYEHANGVKSAVELSSGISSAMDDVQRSFQLQSELLQIYEELSPTSNNTEQLVPAPPRKVDKIEALLQQNHGNSSGPTSTVTHRRPSFHSQPASTSKTETYVDPPAIVKRTGVFAFYSLFLWFLGILTSLVVIEYVSVADWAVDASSISRLVY